ncbi:unnamed protein product [Prorocentrum cordatum]|uniref:Uncharacterized protein n=1 Tax=Prorocentrum cordatum TaxID=2364126 RepID=A0ABN9QQT6_9DINO|nr:unnamed protein product [Polarella glacialis]
MFVGDAVWKQCLAIDRGGIPRTNAIVIIANIDSQRGVAFLADIGLNIQVICVRNASIQMVKESACGSWPASWFRPGGRFGALFGARREPTTPRCGPRARSGSRTYPRSSTSSRARENLASEPANSSSAPEIAQDIRPPSYQPAGGLDIASAAVSCGAYLSFFAGVPVAAGSSDPMDLLISSADHDVYEERYGQGNPDIVAVVFSPTRQALQGVDPNLLHRFRREPNARETVAIQDALVQVADQLYLDRERAAGRPRTLPAGGSYLEFDFTAAAPGPGVPGAGPAAHAPAAGAAAGAAPAAPLVSVAGAGAVAAPAAGPLAAAAVPAAGAPAGAAGAAPPAAAGVVGPPAVLAPVWVFIESTGGGSRGDVVQLNGTERIEGDIGLLKLNAGWVAIRRISMDPSVYRCAESGADIRLLGVPPRPDGSRQRLAWREAVPMMVENPIPGWLLDGPRTMLWCAQFIDRKRSGPVEHYNSFVAFYHLTKEDYGAQLYEYIYSMELEAQQSKGSKDGNEGDGKKRGRGRGGGPHRFGIVDEAAVFTGAAKEDGRSMICPLLLEHVSKQVERDAGILKQPREGGRPWASRVQQIYLYMRSVRRRLEKRSHVHGMVEEMTVALNELWGCPPAARRQAPAGTPVPAAGHALVLSELRQAAVRFGPCPEDLDGPGALEELRISQSHEGDATLVAPVSFDLVDSISLPPAGSQPVALETIDEMAGQNIAHRLKELLLPRQLGMERIKEAGPRRLYTDPALRNPRLYATVARRLMNAGLVDFSSSAECYVGMFFVRKKNGRELTWCRALLPLCFRDAGRPLSPVVSCVDASWWGAGVTESTITSDQARRLSIFNERWRFSRDGEQQVAPRDKALALERKQAERITSPCIKQASSEPSRDPAVIAAVMEQQVPFRVEPKPNQEEEVTFEEVPEEAVGLGRMAAPLSMSALGFMAAPAVPATRARKRPAAALGVAGTHQLQRRPRAAPGASARPAESDRRAVRRQERASRFPSLPASAPRRGLTFLEEQSVGDATRADYQRRQAAFSLWACQRGHSLATPAEVDKALALFFHEEFLDGGESSDAWKLMAALAFARSDLGPRQGRLPRAARAAKGWSRLAPPRSRLPPPWPVACLIVETLCRRGLVVHAWLTALTFGLYLRPREALDLVQSQLIPPGFTTATAMHHWRVVLHLFERQTPSKTGAFDESLLVDSSCFPWMPSLVQELHRRTPAGHRLFPVTYAQWNYHFKAVVAELGLQVLGNLTLHQLRHGGASHELYAAARPLRDIQKRGRWATVAALRRYAKGGRVQEQLHRLPRALLLRAEQAFRGIGRTAPVAGAAIGAAVGAAGTVDFVPADGADPAPEQVEEDVCMEPEGYIAPPLAGRIPAASPVEAYGRRRHTRAPGEPPGEDPFPGWPNHLLDGLLQGGAWFGLMMFGGARWRGFPHWLQYLLVFFYLLSALVALDLLTLLAYALALLSRGKGPLRRNEHPHPLKDSRPVRGGPASGGTTPNKFFQDWIRARGRHSSRRPHELLAIIEEGMVRMQRKPGSTLPATRKGGQVYLYGAVLHCADPSLRQRLGNARKRAVYLAREWEAEIPPDIVAVSYHYTGVEEGLVLNLEEALPYQGASRDPSGEPSAVVWLLEALLSAVQDGVGVEAALEAAQDYYGEDPDTCLALVTPCAEELEATALRNPASLGREEQAALGKLLRHVREKRLLQKGQAGILTDPNTRLLVQHLNLSQRMEADDSKNVEGPLGYLKTTECRLAVYTARGFNAFYVAPCPGLVGRELCDAARRGGDGRWMIMHEGGCPILVVNWVAYAIAGGFWGGRDLERMAKWPLGASDFPRTTREEFERFIPHSDPTHMEKRPAWTKILAVWTDQAHRSITTFCLFYGQDHERERRDALRRLVQLNLDDPNQWTEGDLFAIWEELHWDWWDGIRLIVQRALHDLRNQNPTEEEFRLHLLEGPGGQPRFQMPLSFQLDHPNGFFRARVVSRKFWEQRSALSALSRTSRAKVPPPPPAGRAGQDDNPQCPIGTALEAEGHKAALAGIPKNPQGKRICIPFNCHSTRWRGSGCRDAHQKINDLKGLPMETRLLFFRFGGFHKLPLVTPAAVDARMAALRKGPKPRPRTRGGQNANRDTVLSVLTDFLKEPTELEDYTGDLEGDIDPEALVKWADFIVALRVAVKPATSLTQAALVKQLEALASFHEDTWHLADGMSDWCTRVARRLRAMMRHVEQDANNPKGKLDYSAVMRCDPTQAADAPVTARWDDNDEWIVPGLSHGALAAGEETAGGRSKKGAGWLWQGHDSEKRRILVDRYTRGDQVFVALWQFIKESGGSKTMVSQITVQPQHQLREVESFMVDIGKKFASGEMTKEAVQEAKKSWVDDHGGIAKKRPAAAATPAAAAMRRPAAAAAVKEELQDQLDDGDHDGEDQEEEAASHNEPEDEEEEDAPSHDEGPLAMKRPAAACSAAVLRKPSKMQKTANSDHESAAPAGGAAAGAAEPPPDPEAKDGEIGAELMREAERARRGIEATKQGRWSTSEMADGATLAPFKQTAFAAGQEASTTATGEDHGRYYT